MIMRMTDFLERGIHSARSLRMTGCRGIHSALLIGLTRAAKNRRTPVVTGSVLISGSRLCEPQRAVLQMRLLRVTDPRSVFKS